MLSSDLTKTTRHTSPEPTGIEKVFQDAWDSKRDEQVRTFMVLPTDAALRNFTAAVLRGIETAKATPKKKDEPMLLFVYGSYDRTDQTATSSSKVETFLRRLASTNKCPLTKILTKAKVVAIKKGLRQTGVLLYEDGTMDVCDPTKATVLAGKAVKAIKQIDTFYVVLTHM